MLTIARMGGLLVIAHDIIIVWAYQQLWIIGFFNIKTGSNKQLPTWDPYFTLMNHQYSLGHSAPPTADPVYLTILQAKIWYIK